MLARHARLRHGSILSLPKFHPNLPAFYASTGFLSMSIDAFSVVSESLSLTTCLPIFTISVSHPNSSSQNNRPAKLIRCQVETVTQLRWSMLGTTLYLSGPLIPLTTWFQLQLIRPSLIGEWLKLIANGGDDTVHTNAHGRVSSMGRRLMSARVTFSTV